MRNSYAFKYLVLVFFYCISIPLFAQVKKKPLPPKTSVKPKLSPNYLDTILLHNRDSFADILSNPKMHHVQIIYTQINRDKNNKATFTNYTYRLNKEEFFYAASMVKLPSCALALEKVEELSKVGVKPNTTMLTGMAHGCQMVTDTDTSSSTGYPSVAHYIRRMLLVSDNTAYSRIYEFLTPEYINKKLWNKGYPLARIRLRFDVDCLGKPNNYTNPINFLNDTGRLIYTQAAKYYPADQLSMPVKNTIKYIDFRTPEVSMKKDFSHSNFLCLQDMHEILKSVMFPRETLPNKAFRISMPNRKFMWKYMQMMPYESDFPKYTDRNYYIDSYKKYLYYGQDSQFIENKNIRIFNVVGESYGYTTDCAYFVDFENKIEFILTATYFIQEPNGVIDATEENYIHYVMPFFRNLGQSVYNFERNRNRKFLPDLLEFKF